MHHLLLAPSQFAGLPCWQQLGARSVWFNSCAHAWTMPCLPFSRMLSTGALFLPAIVSQDERNPPLRVTTYYSKALKHDSLSKIPDYSTLNSILSVTKLHERHLVPNFSCPGLASRVTAPETLFHFVNTRSYRSSYNPRVSLQVFKSVRNSSTSQ